MGNCCEAVDLRLEEMFEAKKINTNLSTRCNSWSQPNSTHEGTHLIIYESIHNPKKLKYLKIKLNTLIEDSHEDIITSPFIFRKSDDSIP